MPRMKVKCWTVLVQDLPITAYEAETVETFAVLLIEADTKAEAERKAESWWTTRHHILLPHISRTAWDYTALDAPIIKVSE